MDVTVVDVGSNSPKTRRIHYDTIVDLFKERLSPGHCSYRWININQPPPKVILILRKHTELQSICRDRQVAKSPFRLEFNGYIGVPFPVLRLGSSTNVPSKFRGVHSPQMNILQDPVCIIISNLDNNVLTIFDSAEHDIDTDTSIRNMFIREGADRQIRDVSLLV
ncbi:hypothetical protein QQX98_009516 [Neonectria punicea]|uniref:Uncharacterized protein n=1 Tax=Neonectria punicea TaxID=979145 RepID=A0ABR1GSD3_9HYPO